MEIKTANKQLVYLNKAVAYTLEVDGVEVKVEKWWSENMNDGYDHGYAIENEDDLKEKMPEEQWEELVAYINNLV